MIMGTLLDLQSNWTNIIGLKAKMLGTTHNLFHIYNHKRLNSINLLGGFFVTLHAEKTQT